MKKILFLLILCSTFFSCRKVIDMDIADSEKHLVVNCLLSTDSVLNMYVGRSLGLLEDDYNSNSLVNNATIQLFEDGVFVEELQFCGTPEYELVNSYKSTITPKIGSTYSIEVSAPGYPTVSANCVIPERVEIGSLSTYFTINEWGEEILQMSIGLNDNAATENYYQIGLSSINTYEYYDYELDSLITYSQKEDLWAYPVDPWLDNIANTSENGLSFSDATFNGTNIVLNLSTYIYSYNTNETKILIDLYSISKEYYNYLKSKSLYEESDPAFSEPVQIFSNIENGLGIFAGASISSDSVIVTSTPIEKK